MDILEQPLEAVAFRIHSLPEVAAAGAAAWTCLAAVLAAAAAAGVWRLRSSTPSSTVIAEGSSKPLELDTSPLLVPAETERSLGSWRSSEPTMSSSLPALSPRERYTAYYHDSGCVGCCDVESDEEEEDRDPEDDYGVYGPAETDPSEWEVVRSLPLAATTATGTWRYKSPRALSGSVVRLWDEGADGSFMAAAASRRRRGRAGAVSSF
ncbi:hypothetical protein CFC21_101600 [Triticum aestivum]|uniref:Uncharacterized protein n=3 Tax=Triticum TaxID=4564 RepID=A0A9R1BWQ5_TRITD|nr:uncharacterized protein LOC123159237 [Triticum aestivum]KAF7100040.1 hypothetical protein CFC21_101600 [Triticum aestivum]VAI83890.1 unnamed protein product [Triticum turgidum subsp. durum]